MLNQVPLWKGPLLLSALLYVGGGQAAEPPATPAFLVQASERHWSAGHITADHLPMFQRLGIERIITLRPADEAPLLADEAAAQGLTYHALPIAGAEDLTREQVEALDRLLAEAPDDVTLIHCASGNRVGAMMALRAAWMNGADSDSALAIGQRYGLTSLATAVRARLSAPD